MKIGILQTGLAPDELVDDFGEYPAFFERLLDGNGFTFQSWSVVQHVFPDGPEDADGWLITGSKHGAYEDHDWIPPLEQLIRDIVAAERPLIGVCFGHQIIAQALGGKVNKFEGGWVVGQHHYTIGDEVLTFNAWHQDQVIEAPQGAEVVGTSNYCANAALLYPGKAFTVQPHPEYGDDFIQGLIDTRGKGVVPDDLMEAAQTRMGQPLSNQRMARQFATFFREGRLS
ncbi:type 1 glutamine amidotransferase [Marivita hallyeonensis]|uniref:GMP synthase (Glutamine-hydrolysing) n=1 Tax=Marivita hallyeonensis TaxID=996342 RepID=A0A1M5W9H3_9RHOB|nr:type 1 glutamine amidotransferase [Marivita hallyeonensis]SHH83834.1 GMP synthase (glutamine-hydrolysing) [Marivita hallyeonensis]